MNSTEAAGHCIALVCPALAQNSPRERSPSSTVVVSMRTRLPSVSGMRTAVLAGSLTMAPGTPRSNPVPEFAVTGRADVPMLAAAGRVLTVRGFVQA